MNTLLRTLTLATALTAPLAALAGPSLIVNGSFEADNIATGSWSIWSNLTGWTGAPNIELRDAVAGTAQDGSQYVELDTTGNSAMWQQVATAAGTHYTLSWFYSPRLGVATASNPIEVLWNDVLLTTNTGSGAGQSNHVWQQYTFDVVGTGGLDKLTFRAVGTSDSLGGSLDHVDLRAVPEPSTLALLVAAAAGLALRRRRA
mgnify:FL=1|jgi:hypothetical protein